jgi:flavin-dependent dehydrogenase
MSTRSPIVIIGGGLAGLTAAIHLSKFGLQVIVYEKNDYPKHKVCGEYISNEVLSYLEYLDLTIADLFPSYINELEFSTSKGQMLSCKLPLGGFGISRYVLDDFLYKNALSNGCTFIKDTVTDIVYLDDHFTITHGNGVQRKADIVIGAFGKRSNLDQKLHRDFIQKKSHWLAVKGHYTGKFPDSLVGLHNFNGGYCGVSKIENNKINICYLANYKTFKNYKNIEEYQKQVVTKNPHLKLVFDNCDLLFENPLTISQIAFDKKQAVENHILMIGDTAGLIHPLCGNGMAMAIHSAKIASELVLGYVHNINQSRANLEESYKKEWARHFKKRLKMGRMLATILQKERLSNFLIQILIMCPYILTVIIKKTHGKPILSK